jgi:WD40 repeat protein
VIRFGPPHDSRWARLEYLPPGDQLMTTNQDRQTHLWDACDGSEVAALSGSFRGASVTSKQRLILTQLRGGEIRVWDLDGPYVLSSVPPGPNPPRSAVLAADGTRFAAVAGNEIRVWRTVDGQPEAAFPVNSEYIEYVAFSPDSRRLVSAARNGTCRVWNLETGKLAVVLKSGFDRPVCRPSFSADGNRILVVSTHDAAVYDLNSGAQLTRMIATSYGLDAGAWSPDGTKVLTVRGDGCVVLRNAQTGQEVLRLGASSGAPTYVRAKFSRDGNCVAAINMRDPATRIWDASTGDELHGFRTGYATDFALSPNGKAIAIVTERSAGEIRRLAPPQQSSGVFGLPAFWGAVVCAALSFWSFVRFRLRPQHLA